MNNYLTKQILNYLSQIEKVLIEENKFIVSYKINLLYSKVEYKISDGTTIEIALENVLKEKQ